MAIPGPSKRIVREHWPSWRYGPNGEGQIFQSESEVPFGWTKKPGEIFTPKSEPVHVDRQTLAENLRKKGIEPVGWWSTRYMKDMLE
jgi:hypothetical protein